MLKTSSHVCSRCNNSFATRKSLWNHKQRCQGDQSLIGQKIPRTSIIPTFRGYPPRIDHGAVSMSPVGPMFTAAVDKSEKSSKNPKIQSLVDEILNDSSECRRKAPIDPESSKIEVPTPKTVIPMVENNENPVEINATYVPNL